MRELEDPSIIGGAFTGAVVSIPLHEGGHFLARHALGIFHGFTPSCSFERQDLTALTVCPLNTPDNVIMQEMLKTDPLADAFVASSGHSLATFTGLSLFAAGRMLMNDSRHKTLGRFLTTTGAAIALADLSTFLVLGPLSNNPNSDFQRINADLGRLLHEPLLPTEALIILTTLIACAGFTIALTNVLEKLGDKNNCNLETTDRLS